MNSRDQEKLLKEILPRDDLADFRESSLECGLASLRRQRQRRYVLRGSVVAALVCALSVGILLKSRAPVPSRVANSQPSPVSASLSSSHVKFISDEELLALFKNQPVALIGKPGQQRLVLLDKVKTDHAPF